MICPLQEDCVETEILVLAWSVSADISMVAWWKAKRTCHSSSADHADKCRPDRKPFWRRTAGRDHGAGDRGRAYLRGYHPGMQSVRPDSAIAAIKPAVAPTSYVLRFLIGVARVDVLNDTFGKERVIGGTAKIRATPTAVELFGRSTIDARLPLVSNLVK
jgi:hypothetical protein